MKIFKLATRNFIDPEEAVTICKRMGWMPEVDSDTITATVPEEDLKMFELIFDYFL